MTVQHYSDPDYFTGEDVDLFVAVSDQIALAIDRKGAEEWTGKGELILPDFSKFVSFLQRMIIEDNSLGDSQ